ncbi:Na+/H+ antiporter subunit E [Kitasatospora sp. NPDC015120]|uniref:Na+/H+ antiporter subunit E n=1 Tax=Kitasatospora sp. NPDC015120 TaxID=3364023 RepID=UPI0036F49EF5
MRTAVELLLWWGLLLLLYVVLISSVSALEVAVGGGIAALGALGAVAARRASDAAPGGWTGWARALWAFPATLLSDTGRLALLVLRTLRHPRRRPADGGFRTVRLAPGTGAAWAGALLSATPGGFVVEARDGVLTVHALDATVPALQRALTGGPR